MEDEKTTVMSDELAIREVERWAEENDIDLYVKTPSGNTLLDASVPKLVKAIKNGSLVLNDDCEFEYTISKKSPEGFAGKKIVLRTPTGAAYMAMDSYKDHEGVHKTMAIMSAITGQDVSWFARLSNNDYKLINFIVGFFTAG